MRTPPPHRVTTAHLQAAYPFVAEGDDRRGGPLLGRDLLGGVFCFDPWERYAAGEITGPNMVVVGQIGRGKSTFVKTLLWRELVFGRRAWVIDPKGEYGPLAAACGTRPVRLEPGGPTRLNPLDHLVPGGGATTAGVSAGGTHGGALGDATSWRRGADLLASVAASSLGRALQPQERAAVDLAVRAVTARGAAPDAGAIFTGRSAIPDAGTDVNARSAVPDVADVPFDARSAVPDVDGANVNPVARAVSPSVGRRASRRVATVPDVVSALLQPEPSAAEEVRTDVAGLAADGRQVALELRRLVEGDLAGMFDGPTSVGVDLDAPVVVLDLSALYRSPALGIVMICATAWLHAAMSAGDGRKRLVVVDEAWAVLHDLATARWLQASFKLARSLGGAHVAVLHRLSDLQAAGAAGSEQRHLAEGLLADAETRVAFAQPPSEMAAAVALLGLSAAEAELLPQLARGVALWKIGERSVLVRHRVGPAERVLVDTDRAMVDKPGG